MAEQVAIQLKYAGYIDRQQLDIDRLKRHEAMKIPTDLDFARVDGLSNEIRQKLTEVRPAEPGSRRACPRCDASGTVAIAGSSEKDEKRATPGARSRMGEQEVELLPAGRRRDWH